MRKIHFYNRWAIIWLFIFAAGCSKKDAAIPPQNPQQLETVAGIPAGPAISKTIGPAGGSLQSADGNITVQIPTGALTGEQQITVQQVRSDVPGSRENTYRLTPHGIQFQKPVTIRFRYLEDSIINTVPELLAIGYRDASGKWFYPGRPVLDTIAHTISVSTTHFSDWGVFSYLYLEPAEAVVNPGAQLELDVKTTCPDSYLDLGDGIEVPVLFPHPQDAIIKWTYAGEGMLISRGAHAQYNAPAQVPQANPEAVTVSVKGPANTQLFLVSNITIRNDFKIDYMQVDETEMIGGGQNYASLLYLYGNFGDDPGEAKRSVKIGNTTLPVKAWTRDVILCGLATAGPATSGVVTVTSNGKSISKNLYEWVLDMFYDKVESPDSSLTKRIYFSIRLRGDGEGFFRAGQSPRVQSTDLNVASKAFIQMPQGIFTSHVSGDGCGDYTVKWFAISNLELQRQQHNTADGFSGVVTNKADGFEIKLHMKAAGVLATNRKYVDCAGNVQSNDGTDNITNQGYDGTVIPLKFVTNGGKICINGGEMPLKTGTGVASGIYFDSAHYKSSQYTTHLYWKPAVPKNQ